MSDLLSGIFHKLSSNPAVARITAAILTPIFDRIAAWLSRPKHAKAHDADHVDGGGGANYRRQTVAVLSCPPVSSQLQNMGGPP
jgi:hypothetical protein